MANTVSLYLNRIAGDQRPWMLLVGLGALAIMYSVSRWSMSPTWVPVATGLGIERVGEATQRLDDSGIGYRLERGGGMVTVPDADAARARVILASEGLVGSGEGPGFELFDQPSWGMTEFTQRVNYRRALEGELARTIGEMRGIRDARVHLALRQGSFLRGSDEAGEASIVLRLEAGATPAASVVEGVQALVAGSVEGLEQESVMVLDERGRLLSTAAGEGIGLTSVQLKVQQQVQEHVEKRALALVERIVGAGNASVRVAAQLNFDQFERTVQAIDPDEQLVVSEDRAEITPGNEDQGAGSVTSNTVFEATRSLETLTRSGSRLERLTVAVLIADERIENEDGTVSYRPRSAEELNEVQALVANAVGLSPQRGDQLSVVSAPFADDPDGLPVEDEESVDAMEIVLAAQRPVVGLVGLGMALFLALRLVDLLARSGTATSGARSSKATLEGSGEPKPSNALPSGEEQAPAPVPEAPPAPQVQVTDPDMTARVLRSWMKE